MATEGKDPREDSAADWKKELRRKIEAHQLRKQSKAAPSPESDERVEETPQEPEPSLESSQAPDESPESPPTSTADEVESEQAAAEAGPGASAQEELPLKDVFAQRFEQLEQEKASQPEPPADSSADGPFEDEEPPPLPAEPPPATSSRMDDRSGDQQVSDEECPPPLPTTPEAERQARLEFDNREEMDEAEDEPPPLPLQPPSPAQTVSSGEEDSEPEVSIEVDDFQSEILIETEVSTEPEVSTEEEASTELGDLTELLGDSPWEETPRPEGDTPAEPDEGPKTETEDLAPVETPSGTEPSDQLRDVEPSTEERHPTAADLERPLFRASDKEPKRPSIVTFADKAVPVAPTLESRKLPWDDEEIEGQKTPDDLFEDLEPYDDDFPDEGPEEVGATEPLVSKEIFFSRILAGLVDLLLPFATGLLFSLVASRALDLDFFSGTSIGIAFWLSLAFYVVGSLFFLLLSGQTPGMHLAGLRLLHQESEKLAFFPVLIRVIAFPLTVITLAGLLWGLFDPWGRCLHDRLSQTRIVEAP